MALMKIGKLQNNKSILFTSFGSLHGYVYINIDVWKCQGPLPGRKAKVGKIIFSTHKCLYEEFFL